MNKYTLILIFVACSIQVKAQQFSPLTNRYKFSNCEEARSFAKNEISHYTKDTAYILKYFRHKVFDKTISSKTLHKDSVLLDKYRIKMYEAAIWSKSDSCYIKEIYYQLNNYNFIDIVNLLDNPVK